MNDDRMALALAVITASKFKKLHNLQGNPHNLTQKPHILTKNEFLQNICRMSGIKRLTYFAKNNHVLMFDNDYWNVLGTIWKGDGSVDIQDAFVELLRNPARRNKHKIMKTNERREYAKLPKVVTAYRACGHIDEIGTSISWSLDKRFVERYAESTGRAIIATQDFKKSEIFAYFNRRGESEILVRI